MVESAGLHESGGQNDAAEGAAALVVQQARSGQITTRDTFHRHHIELADHQCPTQHLGGDPRIIGGSRQVIRRPTSTLDQVEEEDAHRGQDPALVRDRGGENVIESRDAIRGYEQQMLVVDAIEFANFAAGQMGVIGQGGTHRFSLSAATRATVLGSTT